jgi:hypothetical protein
MEFQDDIFVAAMRFNGADKIAGIGGAGGKHRPHGQ